MLAGALEIQLMADVARIKADMDQAQRVVSSAMDGMKAAAKEAAAALGLVGAGLSVGAVAAFIKNTIEATAKLHDLSVQAGMTVESLSALAAVGKATGTGADMIAAASNKLSKAMATSTDESKGAAAALKALGLNFDAFQKLSPDQRIQQIALAMGQFYDGSQKSAAAMLLFGKAGAEMLPFLKDLAQTGALHAKVTEDQAEAAHRYEVALGKLKAQTDAWKKQLALELIPTLQTVVEEMLSIKTISDDGGEGKGSALLVGIKNVLETIAVLGANAVYMFKAITGEMMTWGMQIDALLHLDFKGFGAIGDEWTQKAAEMRRRIDQTSSNMLGITSSRAGAGPSSMNAYSDPRSLLYGQSSGLPDFHKQLTGLEGNANGAAAQDGQNAYDALIKKIKEKIAAQDEELKLGRAMTEQEKLETKTRADLAELMQKYPGLNQAQVESLLAESRARDLLVHQQNEQIKAGKELNKFFQDQDAELRARQKQLGDERDRIIKGYTDQKDALTDSIVLMQQEGALIGANQQVRDTLLGQLKIELDLKRQLYDIDHNLNLDAEGKDAARRQAQDAADLAKQAVATKAALDEQQRIFQSMDQTASQFFQDLFTNGSNAFHKLTDTLKSTLIQALYEMTVRPWIVQIAASLTGSPVGGMVGGGGMGGMGGLGSALGSFGSLGGFSIGEGGALGMFGQAASATMSNGLISGFGANMANIGTLAAGGEVMGAIGAAMPYLGAAMLAASALGLFNHKGGPKTESGFGYGIDRTPNPGASQAIAQGIQQQYASMVSALGGTPGTLDTGVFTAQDPQGTAMTQLQVAAALNGSSLYSRAARMGGTENVGRSDADLQAAITEETQRVVLEALQKSGLTGAVGDYLKQLGDINTLSGGDLGKAMTHIQQAQALQAKWLDLTLTDEEKLANQRAQELAGLDDANKAMAERIYALEDEAKAQAQAAAAIDKAAQSARDASTFISDLQKNIGGYLDKLNGTPAGMLAPETQLANSRSAFEAQLALARGGDRTALQGITGYADQLISAQSAYTASGPDTANTIAYIKQALAGLPGMQSDAQYLADTIKGVGDKIWDGLWGTSGVLATKFDTLDTNVDGLLSFDELKAALGPMASDDTLRSFMAKADTNGDGQISKLEAIKAAVDMNTMATVTSAVTQEQTTAAAVISAVAPLASLSDLVGAINSGRVVNRGGLGGNNWIDTATGASISTDLVSQAFASMPSYDVGTPYVPADGPAYLHQGERVLTRAENAAYGTASQEELQALRQEVRDGFARLIGVTVAHAQGALAQGAEIAENTGRTKLDALLAESAHR